MTTPEKGQEGRLPLSMCFAREDPFPPRTGKVEFIFASEPSNFLFSYLFTFLLKSFIITIQGFGDRVCFSSRDDFGPPAGIWQHLGTVLVLQLGGKVLLISRAQNSELPPPSHILLGIGQPTPTPNKELSDLNVKNAEVKKSWDRGKKDESF